MGVKKGKATCMSKSKEEKNIKKAIDTSLSRTRSKVRLSTSIPNTLSLLLIYCFFLLVLVNSFALAFSGFPSLSPLHFQNYYGNNEYRNQRRQFLSSSYSSSSSFSLTLVPLTSSSLPLSADLKLRMAVNRENYGGEITFNKGSRSGSSSSGSFSQVTSSRPSQSRDQKPTPQQNIRLKKGGHRKGLSLTSFKGIESSLQEREGSSVKRRRTQTKPKPKTKEAASWEEGSPNRYWENLGRGKGKGKGGKRAALYSDVDTDNEDEDDDDNNIKKRGRLPQNRNLKDNSWENLIDFGSQLPSLQDLKSAGDPNGMSQSKKKKGRYERKSRKVDKYEAVRRGNMLTFQTKVEREEKSRSEIKNDQGNYFAPNDELQCIHFQGCSGCSFNSELKSTPIMEEARNFFQSLNPPINNMKISLKTPHQWRTQAKLAVAPISKWGGVEIGLYREGSHDVVPIPQCQVHHPSINIAVKIISKACEQAKIRAYDEEKGEGQLRYIQLAVDRRTQKVQATFIWNAEDFKAATPELQRFVKILKSYDVEGKYHTKGSETSATIWHSIYANFKVQNSNSIFNRNPLKWHSYFGGKYVSEAVGPLNIVYYFVPQLFRQGNLDGFSSLVQVLKNYVPENAKVCELYAGVGIIGLNLIDKIQSLKFSDINPFLEESVIKTLNTLYEKTEREEGIYLRKQYEKNIAFQVATAEEALFRGDCSDADVLIVDPPRKGLEKSIIDQLVNIEAAKPKVKGNKKGLKIKSEEESSNREEVRMMEDYLDADFELVDVPDNNMGSHKRKGNLNNRSTHEALINPEAISPHLKRIIYVSCGFQALKRDAHALVTGGGGNKWRVTHAEGFVLFPGSDHIETLCIFDRVEEPLKN